MPISFEEFKSQVNSHFPNQYILFEKHPFDIYEASINLSTPLEDTSLIIGYLEEEWHVIVHTLNRCIASKGKTLMEAAP